jgi:hypothetical protein
MNTAIADWFAGMTGSVCVCFARGPLEEKQEFRMADSKQPRNYSPYQQKIIKRYYDNQDTLSHQRLADLVGELYLAEGKKKERAWVAAGEAMQKLQLPQSRIDHLMNKKDPALLAELLKELEAKK